MINFVDAEKSLKAAWVDRYRSSENSDRCAFLDSMLQELGGSFLFQCNYDLKLLGLTDLRPFTRAFLLSGKSFIPKHP